MKKDLIFAPAMLVIGVLLFMLRLTGMPVHIGVSVAGVFVLVAYAVLTKKEWKLPALEIAMRAMYGIALITGVVIINVAGLTLVVVIHKICAALFTIALIGLFAHKFVTAKKK